ncbi:MAG: tetratricopeptide repeat protein [Candidatus Marinimicrobia bacterium]|nr:tetratricopeptide repeat protein [Candidatus Neomarinimicrobiota bacterium]
MRITTKLVIYSVLLMLSGHPLYAQSGETDEEAKERIINNLMVGANKAFTDGNISVAKDSLKNLLGIDSQFAPAYFLYGKINVREKNYVEAGSNIRRSIELDPDNDKYRKELKNIIGLNYNDGNLEYKKGSYAKALEKYDTVLMFDANYSSAYYMKGIIAKRQRNNKESIKQFTRAIKADPTMSKAYYARGNSYLSDRNYDMAIKDFETATSLNPMDAKAWTNIGAIELNRKNYDKVIKATQKAIKADPKLARAYRDQGIAYSKKGDWAKAVSLQEKATSLNKRDSRAFFHLAEAYNQMNNCEGARDAALAATGIKATNGGSWIELGLAYKCLTMEAEAIAAFEKARRDSRWRELAIYNIDIIVNKSKYNLED